MKKAVGIFLVIIMLASALIPINFVSAQQTSIPKRVSLHDLGILQLVAHDLYHVDRVTEIDAENQKLDLSTVLDQGEENIANGGEPRNMENIMVFTVAKEFGMMYLDLVDKGLSSEKAHKIIVEKYLHAVKQAYEDTFDERFPKAAKESSEEDDDLTGDLALRTVHDLLPGKIRVNGVLTPVLDQSLFGKTLGKNDLKQLSAPLDGQFDPEFRHMTVFDPHTNSFIVIDLLEKDSSFAQQFNIDFSFEFFLDEIKDGHYDTHDKVMEVIRAEMIEAQIVDDSSGHKLK